MSGTNEIRRVQRKLNKTFGNAVTAVREGDTIRVSGSLPTWEDILKACNMAVSKDKRRVHVVNDITLEGAEPIPMRVPFVRDDALDGKHVDVLVIGGGISGTSIARELAKWDLDILLVEKEADFALQASGRNDGEVHPGIDLGKGSLKQKYVLEGNHMYDRVCADLNVPFRRIGQYACFTQGYLRPAVTLLALWRKYHDGVTDVKIVGKEQLLRDNPTMNPDFAFAMYNPSAGIVSPYNLTIAYAENAAQNGVELSLNTAVLSMDTDGGAITAVHTNRGTVYPTVVVNAAGVFADDVAEMAHDRFYSIHPRRGTDTIQDVKSAKIINTIASIIEVNKQALTSHTKGGGLMQTAHGNVLAGPDAVECREKEDFSTRPESIRTIYHKQQKTVPAADPRDIITYFTGVRAPTFEEDFVIEWGRNCKNLYHVGGIQSPGLTSAPAFALDVANDVAERIGQTRPVSKNERFDPRRKGIPELRKMAPEERAKYIAENPDYGVIICRCEEVSKGEILDALNSPCCPPTIDAVKKRVRPGMGRCQGGFCSPLVAQIIAEHEGIPLTEVRKSSEEAVLFYGPTKGGGPHD
ncbi:MAG: FAD-dependent oxidoreductase [Ruminococcaceae bacterium]|nr:FAD-dependent oxidoreductase [Oscillospiraceae bacterium]